jgi:DNA-binding transcriptional LysR family regulator
MPSIESLRLFQELLAKKNLGAAAAELGIPGSTASRYLNELRSFFDDPLFSRCKQGLIPTRRALSFAEDLAVLIRTYNSITSPRQFNLATEQRNVRVGCVDNAPFTLFPDLIGRVNRQAPGVTLSFTPLSGSRYEMLRLGELDFFVSPSKGEDPEGFHSLSLGENRYVLVASADHPLAGSQEPVSDQDVLKYPFIDIVGKRANIEQSLRESRFPEWKDAHSAARSYFFLPFVPSLASRHSNLLMVLPERTVHRLQRTYDLRILRTQTEGPADNPRIIWHDLTHSDPLMQWIRSMFLAAASD